MTALDDITSDLLDGPRVVEPSEVADQQLPSDFYAVQHPQLLRDHIAMLMEYRGLQDQHIELLEAKRAMEAEHGLELAHQRAEIRNRIEALGLPEADAKDLAFQLLDRPAS